MVVASQISLKELNASFYYVLSCKSINIDPLHITGKNTSYKMCFTQHFYTPIIDIMQKMHLNKVWKITLLCYCLKLLGQL